MQIRKELTEPIRRVLTVPIRREQGDIGAGVWTIWPLGPCGIASTVPIRKGPTKATMMFGCLATYLGSQYRLAARPWEIVVNVNDFVSREDELINHVLHFLR